MFYRIDNYGNKVELSHDELVANYTPTQLVNAGYKLIDLKDAYIAVGVEPSIFDNNTDETSISQNETRYVRTAVARYGFGLDRLI